MKTYASKLDAALDHAAHGFPVFPVKPNAKTPMFKGWQADATTDPVRITKTWTDHPTANIGTPTDDLLVVDVDPKKGGMQSMQRLNMISGFTQTRWAITRSDGLHMLYKLPPHVAVSSSVERLGPGLDVRSSGGLIVMPGSTIGDKAYRWANDVAMVQPDEWLVTASRSPAVKAPDAGTRLVEEDATALKLAKDWLAKHAPDAQLGTVDVTAHLVAKTLFDFGVSPETCAELLHKWAEVKEVPIDSAHIAAKVASGLASRQTAVGSRHPGAGEFEPVVIAEREQPVESDIFTAPTVDRAKFYTVRADEGARLALQNPLRPLIKGIMNCGTEVSCLGAPGEGKTFVLLDMCWHIARGLPWRGRRVQQGAVIFVAAEAQAGIFSRLAGLASKYGPLGDAPLYIVPAAPDLAHGAQDTNALIVLAKETAIAAGYEVVLIVVDTLSRALAGGDENSSKDMGAVVVAIGAMRRALGCTTLVVHHPGLTDKGRGRGWSGLLGAVDTEMIIRDRTLLNTKQKDMAAFLPVAFQLTRVVLGKDAEGDEITTCCVEDREAAVAPDGDDIVAVADQWLKITAAVRSMNATKNTFSRPEVVDALIKTSLYAGEERNKAGQCADKWREKLREAGEAEKGVNPHWVTLKALSL